MSRYRNVSVGMWDSPDFLALSPPQPNAQTCWQHLITGKHTCSIPGLFSAGKASLAETPRWPLKAWDRCFAEVEARGMAVADWDARVVWLPRAIFHNPPSNPNVVVGWKKAWDEIPPCALRDRALRDLWAFLDEWSAAAKDPAKRQSFRQSFAESFRQHLPRAFGESLPESLAVLLGKSFVEVPSCARIPAPAPALWSESGGGAGGERAPMSLDAATILTELRKWPNIELVATPEFADVLAGIQVSAAKVPAWVLQAIREAGQDAKPGLTEDAQRSKVRAFVTRARAPYEPRGGPKAAPFKQPPSPAQKGWIAAQVAAQEAHEAHE